MPNQPAGAFWAVLNRLLIIGQTVVLILSEFGWPASFFNRYFPVLGKDFGLGALGIMQCLYVTVLTLNMAFIDLVTTGLVLPFFLIALIPLLSLQHFSCSPLDA